MPLRCENRLQQLVDLELLRRRLERLHHRVEAAHGLDRSRPEPRRLRVGHRLEQRHAEHVGVRDEPLQRRVAETATRPVRDPQQRDGVGRVVEHGEVRDRVLDLRALVEAWPADHLVRDLLAHEHVLEHAALGVRAVEDRELGRRPAVLDETCDLRGDVPRLGVLVLHLDDLDRIALSELGEEVLRPSVAVVLDHRIGCSEDRVRGAVVLLQRDRVGAGEVALEVEDVVDVGAAEAIDRLIGVTHAEHVRAAHPRAAAATGTARGSCPGTRRRGCSGTCAASAPSPPGSARAPRP